MKQIILITLMLILSTNIFADSTLYLDFAGKYNKVVISDKLLSDFQNDGWLYLECIAATSEVDEDQVGEIDEDWKENTPNIGAYARLMLSPRDSYMGLQLRVATNDSRIAENSLMAKTISTIITKTELRKDSSGDGPALRVLGQTFYDLVMKDSDQEYKEIKIQKNYPNINDIVDKGFSCYIYEDL